MRHFQLKSEHETDLVAEWLVPQLRPGHVVFLKGSLGVGKTRFVKGVASAMGYLGQVKSPTYNLVLEYRTNPIIVHADLYRVKSAAGLGIEDYFDSAIFFIEWPERDPEFFSHCQIWLLNFSLNGEVRELEISAPTGIILAD